MLFQLVLAKPVRGTNSATSLVPSAYLEANPLPSIDSAANSVTNNNILNEIIKGSSVSVSL